MDHGYAFISYAKEDADQVRRLATRIREAGYKTWLDEHDLLPGQDWDSEIRSAIRRSRVFVLCLSDNAVTKSGYIQREIREALAVTESMPDGKVFIIPVRLAACSVPERLQRWQWIDLFKRGAFGRLKDVLASHLGAALPARRAKELPQFVSATDHLLYEMCLRAGRLFHCDLGKRYLISQGHFAVTRETFPESLRTLSMRLAEFRELPVASARKLLPKSAPWRTERNRVHSIHLDSNLDAVLIRSASSAAYINAEYWSTALLMTRNRKIFMTGRVAPVYVEGDDSTQVVVMPLNLGEPPI